MPRVYSLALAAAMLFALAADASALDHWQRKSVMNNTGCQAPPVWGFGVPPETWGWFGVRYWPRQSWHTGYYGDMREWGYRQGY
jgi:hypothetical protein